MHISCWHVKRAACMRPPFPISLMAPKICSISQRRRNLGDDNQPYKCCPSRSQCTRDIKRNAALRLWPMHKGRRVIAPSLMASTPEFQDHGVPDTAGYCGAAALP